MVQQYLDHSLEILTSPYSQFKGNSKNSGLISLFGYQNEYNLMEGFPIVTTKRLATDSAFGELLWMLRGETNIKMLVDAGIPTWNKDTFHYNLPGMVDEGIFPEVYAKNSPQWLGALDDYVEMIRVDEDGFSKRWGDAGRIYGAQWRRWRSVDVDDEGNYIEGSLQEADQLEKLIAGVKKNPFGKKHIMTCWNPGELKQMSLPPCHRDFHINVSGDGGLDLMMNQRSCDMFLGVPFNIAQYAMLNHVLARELDLTPRRFIHTFGDAHFYPGTGERLEWYGKNFEEFQKKVSSIEQKEDFLQYKRDLEKRILPFEPEGQKGYDHITGILAQMSRVPRAHPEIEIASKPIEELWVDDFNFPGYDPHPGIKREMHA